MTGLWKVKATRQHRNGRNMIHIVTLPALDASDAIEQAKRLLPGFVVHTARLYNPEAGR